MSSARLRSTRPRLASAMVRVLVANSILVVLAFMVLSALMDEKSRALAYTLVFSSVVWVAMPVGVVSLFWSSEAWPELGRANAYLGLWVSVAVGLLSSGDLLLSIAPSQPHKLISWQLAGAGFASAATFLAVMRLNPLPINMHARRGK